MPSDGPDNSLLLKILKSDWEDALAGGAYVMIKREKPEYLDQYEEIRSADQMEKLIGHLEDFIPDRNWNELMNSLVVRIAVSYISERISGQPSFMGGYMTLIGHVSSVENLEAGFLGYIASHLDNGRTQNAYSRYLTLDNAFQKSMNTGDFEAAIKLADPRRLADIDLTESLENLHEIIKSISG
jgi:hypothetical protein